MLVSVVLRSVPDDQLEEKRVGPNGFDDPKKLDRCGIEPARSLDSKAALVELIGGPCLDASVDEGV